MSLEAECDRLKPENETMSNRMGAVMAVVGEIVARNSDLEKALPDLKNELDAEQSEMLDPGFKYHQQRHVPAISVSAESRDEAD